MDKTPDKAGIVQDILERVSRGELVTDACAFHGIQRSTLFRWAEADESIRNAYARARIDQAHVIAEQAMSIADGRDAESKSGLEAMIATLPGVDERDRDRVLNSFQSAAVQRDRLRVDTRKWFTAKLAPRLYGDKLDITSDGEKIVPALLVVPQEG